MELLQIPSSSPSKLTQRSAPTSPRRHIHSSFPYYFYSTPSTPNSDGLSAFVALCESRLSEPGTTTTSESITFNCPPVALATADDLFHNGKLLPSEPLTASPLKLPPRLQYIKNIRKSLRSTKSLSHRRSPRKTETHELNSRKEFDPFAIAMETVRKEDAPWCQVSSQHRRTKSNEHMWLELDPVWEFGDANNALVKVEGRGEQKRIKKGSRILNYFKQSHLHGETRLDPILEGSNSSKSTTSCESESKGNVKGNSGDGWKKGWKRIRIFEYIRRVMKGNAVCNERLIKKESAGIRTVARYRQNHHQHILLACLGLV